MEAGVDTSAQSPTRRSPRSTPRRWRPLHGGVVSEAGRLRLDFENLDIDARRRMEVDAGRPKREADLAAEAAQEAAERAQEAAAAEAAHEAARKRQRQVPETPPTAPPSRPAPVRGVPGPSGQPAPPPQAPLSSAGPVHPAPRGADVRWSCCLPHVPPIQHNRPAADALRPHLHAARE